MPNCNHLQSLSLTACLNSLLLLTCPFYTLFLVIYYLCTLFLGKMRVEML